MNPSIQLRRLILQDLLLIALLIVSATAAFFLGASAAIIFPTTTTLLFFLLLLIAMYVFNTRRMLRSQASIRAAQPQVQWQYQPTEWRSFITSPQLQSDMTAQVQVWQPSLLGNTLVISIAVFFILAFTYREQGFTGLIGPAIVSIGLFGLLVRSARRVQQSLRHPYGQANLLPQVVISPIGAILGSQTLLFKQPRATIRTAEITPAEPRALRIQLEYTMGRQRILPYTILIPIPGGQEAEAEMIRHHIPRT